MCELQQWCVCVRVGDANGRRESKGEVNVNGKSAKERGRARTRGGERSSLPFKVAARTRLLELFCARILFSRAFARGSRSRASALRAFIAFIVFIALHPREIVGRDRRERSFGEIVALRGACI